MTAPTKPEPPTESFARPSYFTKTSKQAAAEWAERTTPPAEQRSAQSSPQIVRVDVDDQRPGWFARLATWTGRTIYLVIFVAAVGAAAAAAVHAWDLRAQHDDDVARITALDGELAAAQRAGADATSDLSEAQTEIATLKSEVTAADKRAEDAETAAEAYRSTLVSEQARSAK